MSPALWQLRWTGRLGNRLFQYAYGATYRRLTGRDYWIPSEWEGSRLFAAAQHRVIADPALRRVLDPITEGRDYDRTRLQALRALRRDAALLDVDFAADPYRVAAHDLAHVGGCAFNAAILAPMSRSHLRQVFEFSDEVKRTDCYQRLHDVQGLYDVAHLRRDDICNVDYNRSYFQAYSVVSMASYRRAFRQFGYDEADIVWVSDDRTGRWHVGRKPRPDLGWAYPEGANYRRRVMFDWLEDFLMLYFARTIFRANSSFSWWAAALSPTARVFSPVIDRCLVYGVDGLEEIDVDFVEGNHPHYMYRQPDPLPDLVLCA